MLAYWASDKDYRVSTPDRSFFIWTWGYIHLVTAFCGVHSRPFESLSKLGEILGHLSGLKKGRCFFSLLYFQTDCTSSEKENLLESEMRYILEHNISNISCSSWASLCLPHIMMWWAGFSPWALGLNLVILMTLFWSSLFTAAKT